MADSTPNSISKPPRLAGGRKPLAHAPRAIVALMLREMQTTYGRSPGGYLWALLEPVLGITLLTIVFSLAFRSPPIGQNFAVFYATGLLPFTVYFDVSGKVAASLQFSRPLFAFPRVNYMDAMLARFLLNGMVQALVMAIVFGVILAAFDTRTRPDAGIIALVLALTLLLALGVGAFNCYMFMRFPAWQRIWAILNRPMFLISCVFFVFDSVPQPFRDILWFNPVVHLVGLMRHAFYPGYEAAYVSLIYVVAFALVPMAIGIALLRRDYRDLIHR